MSDKKSPIISRRTGKKARSETRAPAPKTLHGTQVRFNVVCSHCGAEDTLPFVPKTTGELLCRTCAEAVFGPDWAHGREIDEGPTSYPFTCARCGRPGEVPFEPKPDRELLCKYCMRGEEQPQRERLKRMKRVK